MQFIHTKLPENFIQPTESSRPITTPTVGLSTQANGLVLSCYDWSQNLAEF
jgi:hypothetical protein